MVSAHTPATADRAAGRHRERPHSRIEDGERHAQQHGKPQGSGHVYHRGRRDQTNGEPGPPAEHCRCRQKADTEGQHAGMKVGLEGVRARPRDAVAHGKCGGKRGNRPAAAVDTRADEQETRPDQREREQVAGKKDRLDRESRRAREHTKDLVEHHVSRLHVEQRAVARKGPRIRNAEDRRDVEGLVRDAVAISRSIGGGQHGKGHRRRYRTATVTGRPGSARAVRTVRSFERSVVPFVRSRCRTNDPTLGTT